MSSYYVLGTLKEMKEAKALREQFGEREDACMHTQRNTLMKMKKHAGLSRMLVLETSVGWKQRCARPGLCNCCELIDHLGSLKSALVRVFTSWKLVIVRNQSPLLPPKSKLLNFYPHHH